MADRFPSIEDIDNGDDGFGPMSDGAAGSDFLSRERAVLGADADQFSSSQDAAVPTVAVDGPGDIDLLGVGGQTNGNDLNHFQSSFPAIDTRNERVASGGTITGSTSPFAGTRSSAGRPYSPAPSSNTFPSGEEPEVIKSWRAERDAATSKRETAAAARKESTVKEAQQAVDELYVNYNQKVEKGKAQTRKEAEEFLAKREDTTSGGTSWERIAKLVDLKKGAAGGGASIGKDRFRDLLGSLAKDTEAPGAKGY